MAIIDSYFFALEERLNKAESEFEIEILQKEIRKLYYPPEERKRREKTARIEYRGELINYYIDKEKFVSDLKDLGTSYSALSKALRMKTPAIRRDKKGDYVSLLDGQPEKIQELCGLDVKSYTLSTEPAGRQPQHPINVAPIEKGIKESKLTKYDLSMALYNNSSVLDNYIKKETMPLHRAKEICDILGLEHSEVIIKED